EFGGEARWERGDDADGQQPGGPLAGGDRRARQQRHTELGEDVLYLVPAHRDSAVQGVAQRLVTRAYTDRGQVEHRRQWREQLGLDGCHREEAWLGVHIYAGRRTRDDRHVDRSLA